MSQTPTDEATFKNRPQYSWLDELPADFSDETTVDRRTGDSTSHSVETFQRELSTVVEAVVGADLSAGWIPPLRRAAGSADPMKWDHVAGFVLRGSGAEAAAARDGLAGQALVVTDPMRAVRRLDLSAHAEGRLGIPHAFYLFFKPNEVTARNLDARHSLGIRDALSSYVLESTLDSSGLGLLCDHIARAECHDIDGNHQRRSVRGALMDSVSQEVGGSLNKAARLASKATALAVPIIDPDHPGRARVERRAEEYAEISRWGGMDYLVSQEALGVVAERRLIVDQGHEDITDLTARLRDMAEVHSGFYFDREQAFDALRDAREEAHASGRGFVRAGDDRRDLLLQVADVAAGWARTIIASRGYRELVAVYRCVLYNGYPLTVERAARLDEEIVDHRKLVASFVGKV